MVSKMNYLENVLTTKEAKEAIGEGILELLRTGKFDHAIDSMLNRGEENGSLFAAKLAFLFDLFGDKK